MLAFLAVALLQVASFDVKGDLPAMMREHCRGEWPNDFQMQQFCFEQQVKGALQFKRVAEALGKPIEKALEKCTEEWTKDRLPDWQMIGFCAEQQEKGFLAVNR